MIKADVVLDDAKGTLQARAKDRDVEQERSMEKVVQIFNTLHGRDLTETEGWSFMQVLKMVRCHIGPFKYDDYIDRINYAALEAECRSKS